MFSTLASSSLDPVVLREGATLAVVAALADLSVDLVAGLLPALQRGVQLERLDESHGTVEHYPGHHLRVCEVLSRSARFPDPIVRVAPDRLDVLDDPLPARPQPVLQSAQRLRADVRDAHDLAVDVELELLRGSVTDADRP
jgi:hypothetical protein